MRLKWTCLKILLLLWKQTSPYCVQNKAYESSWSEWDLPAPPAKQWPLVAVVLITTSYCKLKGSCQERTDCQSMETFIILEGGRLSWTGGQLFRKLQPWEALRTGRVGILTFKSHFMPSKASADEKARELLVLHFQRTYKWWNLSVNHTCEEKFLKCSSQSLRGFPLATFGIIWTTKYIMIVMNYNPQN